MELFVYGTLRCTDIVQQAAGCLPAGITDTRKKLETCPLTLHSAFITLRSYFENHGSSIRVLARVISSTRASSMSRK